MTTDEELKKLWNEIQEGNDWPYPFALARAIEQATARKCAEIATKVGKEYNFNVSALVISDAIRAAFESK